jgi:peptidoglycan glycosyltransferase
MQFGREINRLTIAVLVAFALVALSSTYWSVYGPDSILLREDNPRLVEAEAAIRRGDIVDRHGEVLVTSEVDETGAVIRNYLFPEMNSALGYFSLRYGVGGAEAAFDITLRGDELVGDLDDYVSRELLHRPQLGSSVQLTFDLDIQRQIVAAMEGRTGAAIVLSVPSGEVLSLVSLPTYDPNTLDIDWEMLVAAEGNPFFNRALQGNYQPGGMLQTPLMLTALVNNQPLNVFIEDGAAPVEITTNTDGTSTTFSVECIVPPPNTTLTLTDAYVYGCPLPFAQMAESLGTTVIQNTFGTFLMNNPPTLPGFVVEPVDLSTPTGTQFPTMTPFASSEINLQADALGQGELTVTPLNMAVIIASLLNNGNTPQPHALLAVRHPETEVWIPAEVSHTTVPLTSNENALQLQDWMRTAVEEGTAQAAAREGLDIGGQAALAYSGEGSKTWFAGFATLEGGGSVVVVIVLENSANPQEAAQIGGDALAAAVAGIQTGN